MKKVVNILILSFCFIIAVARAGSSVGTASDTPVLEILGVVVNADQGIDKECTVELICGNNTVETITLKNGRKNFTFRLVKDKYYTIRISKNGYLARLVGIDTKMDDDLVDLYEFAFETKLIDVKQSEKVNKDLADFPIAIIYFNDRKECFDYNRKYTASLKKELYLTKN